MRLDVIAVCYIQNESTDSPVISISFIARCAITYVLLCWMNISGARNTRRINCLPLTIQSARILVFRDSSQLVDRFEEVVYYPGLTVACPIQTPL